MSKEACVERTRRVRQTVPQEFAEFQGSCGGRGADAAATTVSIDQSIEEKKEEKKKPGNGCTIVGNARCGICINRRDLCILARRICAVTRRAEAFNTPLFTLQ